MNRNLYRRIFSKRLGMLVPVAEVAKAQGKANGAAQGARVRRPWAFAAGGGTKGAVREGSAQLSSSRTRGMSPAVSLAVVLALWSKAALTSSPLPAGGVITSGSGTISQSSNALTVDQSSQHLSANWQSFDIGADHAVVFNQPNSSAVALNRVIGPDGSKIYGSLTANGHVFLVNPNGVLFAPGAQVSVGGLVASTLAISAEDFAAGRYRFTGGSDAGSVVNEGEIAAGSVVLIGPQVVNRGTIAAPGGNITLAAGDRVTVSMMDGLLTAEVDAAVLNAQIENQGHLLADGGGRVSLIAGRADSALDSLINMEGVVQASSVRAENGEIYLDAGAGGTVYVSGELDVSGMQDGARGGEVTVLGKNVGLMQGARIDASGEAGGGTVLIGGGREGKDPALLNASATFVGPDAAVAADALSSGDGGTVIVYARDSTQVHGTLSARGGAGGGSGGFVETSGGWFSISRAPDIAAPAGPGGTWLIDPYNITVTSGNTATAINTSSPFESNNNSAVLGIDLVNTALNSGDVIIRTGAGGGQSGDISWNVGYTYTGASSRTLTLRAHRDIIVTQDIASSNGALNLAFMPDSDGNGSGATVLNRSLTTNGGSISFGGVGTTFAGSSAQTLSTSGGAVSFGGEVLVANASGVTINTSGGNVTFASHVDSGNRYTLDNTLRRWDTARTALASGTGAGVGDTYLATVTSALEMSAVMAAANGNEVWLGGADLTTEGTWRWVTGPEGLEDGGLGRIFLFETATTRGLTGYSGYNNAYVNFAPGEPNNYGGTEDALSGGYGTAGLWNDYPVSRTQRSVIETNLAPSPLTIDAGAGTVTFSGAVGSNKPLASLAVTASTIAINGGAVTTTGLQTYSGNVTLGSTSTILTQTNANTDFTLQASRAITNASGGNASLTVRTTGNILLGTGSSIGSSSGALNVTLNADRDADSSGGIQLDPNASIVSNGGAITLAGGSNVATGYAYGSSATFGRGIWLRENATLNASGPSAGGNITLRGHGGASAEGVLMGWDGTTAAASIRTSHAGTIGITGIGGGQADGRWSSGVSLWNTQVESASGAITITGTGGSANGTDDNSGIVLNEVGSATDNRIVSASGAITLTGTRGSGTSSVGSGIRLGPGDHRIGQDGTLVASSSSAITLRADTMALDFGTLQSSGTLTVRPNTAGTTVGIAGGTGTLQLSASHFATNFADGFSGITVGSATAGAINVGGATTFNDDITLLSGGNIALNGALNAAGQNVTLTGGNGSTVSGSGGISASGLLLDGNNAIYTLNTATTNNVSTLAAANAATVSYRNSGSLSVGTVEGVSGVTASGAITVETSGATADLTLDNAVRSTTGDIVLAAGRHFINNNATDTGIDPGAGRYLVSSTHPADSVEAMTGYSKRYAQAYTAGATPAYAATGDWFFYDVVPVLSVAPGAASATYGSTPGAFTANYSGFIDGDTSGTAGIGGSASFTIGGGTSSGGYLVAGAHEVSYAGGLNSSLGYLFQDDAASIGELTIDRATLAVTGVTAVGRIYTGLTDATLAGTPSVAPFTNDEVTVSGAPIASFVDENAGTGKQVIVAGFSLSGTDAANYDIVQPAGLTADIGRAPLTVTANDDAKIVTQSDPADYNGVSFSGFVHGEGVADLSGTLSIARSNAGTETVGTYTDVLVPTGYSSGNYDIAYVNGDYRIVPAQQLLVRVQNVTGAYGTAPGYAVTSAEYLDGSGSTIYTLTQTSQSGNTYTYSDGLGGSVTFTVTPEGAVYSTAGHLAAGNYVLAGADESIVGSNFTDVDYVGNLTVTPIGLTPQIAGDVSKIYDGTNTVSGLTLGLSGLLALDLVQVDGTGAFSSRYVGNNLGYTIDGLTLSGADAANYYLTAGSLSGSNGMITPRTLTLTSISANNRVYDGTTAATMTTAGYGLSGMVLGDAVTLDTTGYSALFGDKHVGAGKAVTVSGLALAGADAANYSLAQPTGLTADITPRTLALTGIAANDKVYDGTMAATLTTAGYGLDGWVQGDAVLLDTTGYSALFGDKHAGTGKFVTVNGLALTGADAGNYNLIQPTGLTANITPAPLTIIAVPNVKDYDGTTGAAAIPLVNGSLMPGDRFVTLAEAYASANIGSGLTLVPIAAIDDGNGGGNYALTLVESTSGEIRPSLDREQPDGSSSASELHTLSEGDSGAAAAGGKGQRELDDEFFKRRVQVIASGLKLPQGLQASALDDFEAALE